MVNGTLFTLRENVPDRGGEWMDVRVRAILLAMFADATTLVTEV